MKSIDVEIERWNDLPEQGWHPGNTHIHYDEKEKNPDKRLYLDPRVEDLRMTAISILKRWDLEYATNKYPPGFLTDLLGFILVFPLTRKLLFKKFSKKFKNETQKEAQDNLTKLKWNND